MKMPKFILVLFFLLATLAVHGALTVSPGGSDSNSVYSIAIVAANSVGGQAQVLSPWATAYLTTNAVYQVVSLAMVQPSNQLHHAFPSVTYDEKRGRLISTWTTGSDHTQTNGVILWSQSYNGGKTWTTPAYLLGAATNVSGWGTTHGSITALRDGTLLLMDQRRLLGADAGAYSILWQSTDGGYAWKTNSTIPAAYTSVLCNGPVFETPSGAWIAASQDGDGATGNRKSELHISRNRGASWSNLRLENIGDETSLTARAKGDIYAVVRRTFPQSFVTYYSTNDAASFFGPLTNNVNGIGSGATNCGVAFPHSLFMNDRLYVSARRQDRYDAKLLWAEYPYTNFVTDNLLFCKPSLYVAGVNLSPSVSCWVGSGAVDYLGMSTITSTNAIIWAAVVAENGRGFGGLDAEEDLPRPYIELRRRDLPYKGTVTNWANRGSAAAVSAVSNSAPSVTWTNGGPAIVKLGEASSAVQGLNIGDTSTLAYFHQTNRFTVIWRGALTNTTDYAVLINAALSSSQTGLRVQASGNGTFQIWQCTGVGSGIFGGNYNVGFDANGLRKFGVYALVFQNETCRLYFNGSFQQEARNTGNGTYVATATTSVAPTLLYQTVGTAYGSIVSDFAMWQEPLTENQVAAWSARLNQ